MGSPAACRRVLALAWGVAVLFAAPAVLAAVSKPPSPRFAAVTVLPPSAGLGTVAERPEDLPAFEAAAASWREFSAGNGGGWQVYIDRRSGVPLLVQGPGVRWMGAGAARAATVADLETRARAFVREHAGLLGVDESELVLSGGGSGQPAPDHWILLFTRRVDGLDVEDERFLMDVTAGNLTVFGADRWGAPQDPASPRISSDAAFAALAEHAGWTRGDAVVEVAPRAQLWLPAAGNALAAVRRYRGAVGAGVVLRPAWRFTVRMATEPGTWIGWVDAVTGAVLGFFDDDRYARVKGGVYPVSDDQQCPDGCEQPGFPMPFADVTVGGTPGSAGSSGQFTCAPAGTTATTTLSGPYVSVQDVCGATLQSATCDNDVDLSQGPGTDCTVPPGASAGDTHSARSSFYHLNRSMAKGRAWLPSNTWLQSQLTDNVDLYQTCNAYWNGFSVNFFQSGGGCRNTGEIAGVFVHEWGHGLDENDGGGYDNPSEAYADCVAILDTHVSCVGRGFYIGQNCTGYGDGCLNCTGIRDMDYAQHVSGAPATPAGYLAAYCPSGTGPCGKEVHCESYIESEVLWDLATRDLPASGMDSATAWQLVDKLFFESRLGSGGNAYNCALPSSDGCGAGSWFTKYRNIDDDDGNLANGTPHAAAIYAAFARHGVACGSPSDPSNQSASTCTAVGAATLSGTIGTNAVTLSWTPVAGANTYLVQRNDLSCGAGRTIVARVAAPTTTWSDTGLANGFSEYYTVQAQAANTACEGALSNCVALSPEPLAGSLSLDRASYGCAATVQLRVNDANVGAPTTIATIWSTTESAPETVTLTETPPGSAVFLGSIPLSSGPAQSGDGRLSVRDGDTITARYIDANDGQGGTNVPRQATAAVDCVAPVISGTTISNVWIDSATVSWSTNEPATSATHYGTAKPPDGSISDPTPVTTHSANLTGLSSCTTYYVSVESRDAAGNDAVDDHYGAYYHFSTLDPYGNPCHAGTVSLDRSTYGCSDVLTIQVGDADLNLSPTTIDTATVTVNSTIDNPGETVTLTETWADSSTFVGTLNTTSGPPASGDQLLSVRDGDLITVTYHDANDGSGNPAVSTATATALCKPPAVSGLSVGNFTDISADVSWSTAVDTTAELDWGLTPALGNVLTDPVAAPSHVFTLTPLNFCGTYYFRALSTDAYGNVATQDAAGTPYAFEAYQVPGRIFYDSFETNTGWTLPDEWQIAPPEGLGGGSGTGPDPNAPYFGANVLGDDLTGLGADPGNYETGVSDRAQSPLINATSLVHGQLQFYFWLNTPDANVAAVDVADKDGAWQTVWSSDDTGGYASYGWQLMTLDVSRYSDGNPRFRVSFTQSSSSSGGASGWNVDNLIVRRGDLPQYDACGGCGTAPTFAGLSSAVDVNPCGGGGLQLQWTPAPAWGSGHTGTYSVYRGTTPGFTPSAANRVATGLATTSWLDAAPPVNTVLYYLVRAENDETCGTGPANHGVTDSNTVYLASEDALSQPAPGAVSASLRLSPENAAHVRLTWSAATNAATYHVLRAGVPQGPFTLIGTTTDLFFEDQGQMQVPAAEYYLVRAADACGNEGP